MAGYIFSIGKKSIDIIKECVFNGYYTTNMLGSKTKEEDIKKYEKNIKSTSSNSIPFEATFGDYCSMKSGDNIYFFSDRKIYGIGKLVNIGNDCKFQNYPNSSMHHFGDYEKIKNEMIINNSPLSVHNRWLCTFIPDDKFFTTPVDMDDVLMYKPTTFKSLRTFWKKSFIKLDDDENNSLKEFILLHNQATKSFFEFSPAFHNKNRKKFENSKYKLDYKQIIDAALNTGSNAIKHEMALESAIILELSNNKSSIFGNWDYISHQVEASPFKPIDYMDKIDIFGYRFLPNTKIISKYLIIENKNEEADIGVAEQISKYVDWVVKNYAYGNYEMVEAYIVAPSFSKDLLEKGKSVVERKYIISSHPVENKTWNNLEFISYAYSHKTLSFKKEEI